MKYETVKYSEDEIIRACQKNNPVFQKLLYELSAPRMFGICMRYGKDYHTAEDLLQEGFIKVFQNILKYRWDGSFEGWMRRVFVNTAIEHYRRSHKLHPVMDTDSMVHPSHEFSGLDSLGEEQLIRYINELSPGYRTIFNMYVVDGFSHKEIADELGISEGTSKSQLARARYLLQAQIQEDQSFNMLKKNAENSGSDATQRA